MIKIQASTINCLFDLQKMIIYNISFTEEIVGENNWHSWLSSG